MKNNKLPDLFFCQLNDKSALENYIYYKERSRENLKNQMAANADQLEEVVSSAIEQLLNNLKG